MRFSRATAAAALAGSASAQCKFGGYQGTKFTTDIKPSHELSELTFFKIRDPAGGDACPDLSLAAFQSLNTTKGRPVNEEVKRAIVVLHGAVNDPWNYHAGMLQALEAVDGTNGITPDSVAITAPYFPNDDDAGKGFPYNANGGSPAEKYPSPALAWYDTGYSGGGNNQYPPGHKTVSSFDVLDQIVQWYADKSIFPNIQQIVVAGHSMGAQLAHHYAMVGKTNKQLDIDTPVSYWVGDPSSYAWPSTSRPLPTGKCPTYDDYREGFANYGSYQADHVSELTYNSGLVKAGRQAILDNYNNKVVNIGRATRDRGDYSEGNCSPYTTGQDRNERAFEFLRAFPPSCTDVANKCHTVDIVVSGHDAPNMFKAPAGLSRLFYDNWYGKGGRAYDYGYPRWMEGDDPHPDPAHKGEDIIHTDRSSYAGGKTYRGCWSDVDKNAQTVGSLPVMAYNGPLNTRTYCSNLCTQRNFAIAGVSDSYCYCGNDIGSQTVPLVETSCENPCPGDKNALCGGKNRLSLFSNKALRK